MSKKFRKMQTPEEQYAPQRSVGHAHELREATREAEAEVWELTSPRRRKRRDGRVTAVFGPHSDSDQARADQLRATARSLRAAADAAERPEPKPKRRWFR